MSAQLVNLSVEGISRIDAHACIHTLPVRRSIALAAGTRSSLRHRSFRLQQAKQTPHLHAQQCRRAVQVSATVAETPAAAVTTTDDGFKVQVEDLTASSKRLTITAPPAVCKKAWNKMIKQARKEVKAPGFRDMKTVSEKTLLPFLGGDLGAKHAAVEEVIKMLPSEVTVLAKDAISESIVPVDMTDEKVKAFDVNKPFSYQLAFALPPKLTWARPYKGIKVEVAAAGDDRTDQAKVEQELLQVRKKKGGLKVVQGRGLKKGDTALVDFDARRTDTGEVFAGAKRRKTQLDTDSADTQFLPGVAEAMVGMKVGESREVQLTLPDNFEPAALRGCPVTCQIGISELFEYELAELDDELAEQVAPKAGGAQGLRTQLLKMQQEKTGRDTEQAINEALMAAVVESAQADIPHHFVAEMGRQEYQARLLAAVARKEIAYEQAMQLATPESLDNFTAKQKPVLEQMILRQMAFEHIFAAENLSVSEQEFQQEYQAAKRDFEEEQSEYDDGKLQEQVSETLKGPKILQWLREHSEISMLPPHPHA